MNPESKAIEFQGVGFRLPDGRTLLAALDLTVARGETLVLLGRAGSGKTTTLKLVNRLLDPTDGRVLVENRPTTEWDPIRLRRRIGYVIQEAGRKTSARNCTHEERGTKCRQLTWSVFGNRNDLPTQAKVAQETRDLVRIQEALRKGSGGAVIKNRNLGWLPGETAGKEQGGRHNHWPAHDWVPLDPL